VNRAARVAATGETVTVAFVGKGVKRLVASFAGLTKG
jgi:hypothetical protein